MINCTASAVFASLRSMMSVRRRMSQYRSMFIFSGLNLEFQISNIKLKTLEVAALSLGKTQRPATSPTKARGPRENDI